MCFLIFACLCKFVSVCVCVCVCVVENDFFFFCGGVAFLIFFLFFIN